MNLSHRHTAEYAGMISHLLRLHKIVGRIITTSSFYTYETMKSQYNAKKKSFHMNNFYNSYDLKIQMFQEYRVEKKEDLTIVHPKQHKHTLLWIHGMGEPHDKYIKKISYTLGAHADYFKIILPKAPIRFFTWLGEEYASWFDAYLRGEIRFILSFEEAFNVKQIYDSFQRILLPIIEKQSSLVKSIGGKFIVGGFSQGCGMSIHCLYTKPQLVDAAIGVSGFFFPITKYDPKFNDRLYLIYGKQDKVSEWQHVKLSYYGKISQKKFNFIQGMGHEVNKDTQKAIGQVVNSIIGYNPKL